MGVHFAEEEGKAHVGLSELPKDTQMPSDDVDLKQAWAALQLVASWSPSRQHRFLVPVTTHAHASTAFP